MFCIHCRFEFFVPDDKVGRDINCPNCSLKIPVVDRQVTCFCSECEGRIIVPLNMIGGKGECPHCSQETTLTLGEEAYRFFSTIAEAEQQFTNASLRTGSTIGKYKIIRCLGIGGMGEVYLVEHTLLKSRFALKILRKEVIMSDPELQKRLLREARLAGNIHHPNLISVVDVELDSDTKYAYIVMEYVRGVSIEQLLEVGPLSPLRTLEIIRDTGLALKAASEHHIIHRDIKPANIMLSADGMVKLADLGVAKVSGKGDGAALTLDNAILGTPNYASPEQLRSSNTVDSRADIYSLGVTMHHMLTGIRPFEADSVYGVMAMVLDNPLPPVRKFNSAISNRISALIDKLCAKNADDRPQNIEQMLDLINAEIEHIKKPAKAAKKPLVAAIIGVAVLLVAAIVAVSVSGGKKSEKPAAVKPEIVETAPAAPVAVVPEKKVEVKKVEEKKVASVPDKGKIPERATVKVFKEAKKEQLPEISFDELVKQLRDSDGTVRIEMGRVPEMLKTLSPEDKERLNDSAVNYFNLRCRNLLGSEKYLELHQLFLNCSWLNDSNFFELRDSLPGHLLEVFVRAVSQDNIRLALDTGRLYLSLAPESVSGKSIRQYLEFEDKFTRCDFAACRKIVDSMPEEETVTRKLYDRMGYITEFEVKRIKSEVYASFDKGDYVGMRQLLDEYDAIKPGSTFVSYFRRKAERHKGGVVKIPRNRLQGVFNEALISGDIRIIRFGLANGAELHRMVFGWDNETKITLFMKALQKCKHRPAGYNRQRLIGGILAVLDTEPELMENEFDMLCTIPEFKDYL